MVHSFYLAPRIAAVVIISRCLCMCMDGPVHVFVFLCCHVNLASDYSKEGHPKKLWTDKVQKCVSSHVIFKERAHAEMKTFESLDYCPQIQPMPLIFPNSVPTFSALSPFSHAGTCIKPSADLHHTIRGPASHHPWTCITPSVDLHQKIWTCIRPSGPASFYLSLSGQL